jgi:membrane protein YqaA with SNARE-associated domain
MPPPPIVREHGLKFIERPWVLWAGCLWGLAEATLFFVVPDVLLTFVALYSPRRTLKLVAFILLGSLAGGTAMFYLGAWNPTQAQTMVLDVPFVSPAMFDKTHQGFKRDGLWTLAKAPGNGIPYKVYCVQASHYARWGAFLAMSALARLERFAPFWVVAVGLGIIFRERIHRRPVFPAAIHAVLWILGYAWYWSRIG